MEPSGKFRLGALVAVHFLLVAAPLLSLTFTPTMLLLPALWATAAVPLGSLMTLTLWVGLGPQRFAYRLLAGLAASAYIAGWSFAANVVEHHRNQFEEPVNWTTTYLSMATPYLLIGALFGCLFLAMGRWWVIDGAAPHADALPTRGMRFSVLNLLVVTSSVAVALTLLKTIRGEPTTAPQGLEGWQEVAAGILFFGTFFVNTACAAHAALRPGPIVRNVALVLLVAVLLGIVMSLSMRHDQTAWWLVVGGMLISVLPTLVVVASLLVVRSCGLRLVRKPRAPRGIDATTDGAV